MSLATRERPPTVERRAMSLLHRDVLLRALGDSVTKLDPRVQARNPVMFVVEIGATITTTTWLIQVFGGAPLGGGHEPAWYTLVISAWLWLTVVFANLAEAFAEGRGRAQADTLRTMRQETVATLQDGTTKMASELTKGDVVVVEAGDLIPGDGTVIRGIASVDESAITGESAPVIRESGGDRSAVTGGTRVLSDRIVIEITQDPGHSFLDRMIALVEGAERRKTPNEIALNILLAALTLVFVIVVAAVRLVDLDSNPTNLIEIVEVGKQLLITRGALTTFSIANDVAKYFAILPAIFVSTFAVSKNGQGPLHVLNIMNLGTPRSAVISAIIFNALVIPALIPIALKGVQYRPIGASALLRRNLLIYGLGGIIAPFIGIKLIDLVIHNLLGA
jgi:high-affinity K+ transport system ATPase subunit B